MLDVMDLWLQLVIVVIAILAIGVITGRLIVALLYATGTWRR